MEPFILPIAATLANCMLMLNTAWLVTHSH